MQIQKKLANFNLLLHFVVRWPRKCREVAQNYLVVRECPYFLADVMLRGGVMSAPEAGLSTFDAGVKEGRRQLAVEILRLAGEDPLRLWAIVEKTEIQTNASTSRGRHPT